MAHCGDNWVEQKNGAVIRRFLGHERYSGQVAEQTIADRHGVMRLYVNYFQPSFKLVEKTRNGSAVIKRYSPPATPCDRVIQHGAVSAEEKAILAKRRATLDPMALLHTIREAQSDLAALVSPELRPTPRGESLERFLARLPHRWRQEQEQADRKPRVKPPRAWRTRKDPCGGKIPSKLCGATYWTGCSKIQTPVLRHCWADWKKLNRTVSAGLTCGRCSVRCSGGCSSGEASWQASWSALRPKLRWRTTMECQKWRWPWVTPSADFSVTFLNEAIGTGKYALRGTSRLS